MNEVSCGGNPPTCIPPQKSNGGFCNLLKSVLNAKVSSVLAFAIIVLAATTTAAVTLTANPDVSFSDYSIFQQKGSHVSAQVLGVASYGYHQPICGYNTANCLNYSLIGFSGKGWQVRIDYQLNPGIVGAIKVNTWPFMDNISGSGSGYTGYDLLPGKTYNFVLYRKAGSRLTKLTNLSITAPPAPQQNTPSYGYSNPTPVTPPQITPRVGQIISKNGTVYLVGSNGLYGFPDLATFNSWGYSFSQVVNANTAEVVLSQVGVVPMKQAGCNSPLDQIAGKCGIASYNVNTSPTSLNFAANQGINPSAQALTLSSPIITNLPSSAFPNAVYMVQVSSDSLSWLGIANTGSGQGSSMLTLPSGSSTFYVSVKTTGLAAGTYKGSIDINNMTSATPEVKLSVPVTLIITGATNSTLSIATQAMPNGTAGQNYSFQFTATGGTAPYRWENSDTTHPCCYVSINPTTGAFGNSGSGLTPLPGTWQIGIKVTDATGQIAYQKFSWTVNGTPSSNRAPAAPVMSLGPGSSIPVNVGQQFNFQSSDPDNDTLSFKVDWGDGTQPDVKRGETFAYGSLVGVLHTWTKAGNYTITVGVSDGKGGSVSNTFPVSITQVAMSKPVITGAQGYDPSTGAYTSGIVISNKYLVLYGNFASSGNTVTINGQAQNVTYQSTSQINVLLGTLSGSSVQVTVSNAAGTSNAYTVNVAQPTAPPTVIPTVKIQTTSLSAATVGQAYAASINVTQTGSSQLYVTFNGLPAGIGMPLTGGASNITSYTTILQPNPTQTLNLIGTPTQAGTYYVTLTVDNRNGVVTTQNYTLTVNPAAAPAPRITGAQGYNPSTGVYTSGTITSGKYLVLYGSFASSGNTVTINGQVQSAAYQSASQINVALGTLSGTSASVVVSNSNGTSNAYTVSVSVPAAPVQVTASLTANNSTYLLANVGSAVNYQWSSKNADQAISYYSVDQPTSCVSGTGPFTWVANTLSGSTSGQVEECQRGRTYTITYKVTNSITGQAAVSAITIKVNN